MGENEYFACRLHPMNKNYPCQGVCIQRFVSRMCFMSDAAYAIAKAAQREKVAKRVAKRIAKQEDGTDG